MKTGKKSATRKMKSQDEIVPELTVRIANLDKTVERLQSELVITKNVNDILTNEVDGLQQYQQRQCQHLKLYPDEIVNQIDKRQCIGPVKDDDTPSSIVRFKSHSFRENAYVNRKKCTNCNIKIKLSLTRKRRKALTYAYKI